MSVGWSGGVAKKSGICSSSSSGGRWEGTGPEVIPFVSLPSMIWGSSGRRDGVNGNPPPLSTTLMLRPFPVSDVTACWGWAVAGARVG